MITGTSRIHFLRHKSLNNFHNTFAIQLNDTHPSIAVAELMRLLVDEYLLPCEQVWEITRQTLAYTNHTLLPEALERWPLSLFAEVLPQHLEVLYESNHRFWDEVRRQATDLKAGSREYYEKIWRVGPYDDYFSKTA